MLKNWKSFVYFKNY